jgi:SAM-dependent methyltransferase
LIEEGHMNDRSKQRIRQFPSFIVGFGGVLAAAAALTKTTLSGGRLRLPRNWNRHQRRILPHRFGYRRKLEDRVEYRHGDARELLFPDGTFDGAWTQHVSMNIAEKKQLYEGIRRILKIGGRFALHDVVQCTPGPILFPVPRARTQEISDLQSMEAMRKTILDAGFVLVAWNDVTEGALRFLDAMVARSKNAETPRLGLHLVLGTDFPEMVRNFRRNLAEERCGVVQAVFQRVS